MRVHRRRRMIGDTSGDVGGCSNHHLSTRRSSSSCVQRLQTSSGKYFCENCNVILENSRKAADHRKMCIGGLAKKYISCSRCRYESPNAIGLTQHWQKVHASKKFYTCHITREMEDLVGRKCGCKKNRSLRSANADTVFLHVRKFFSGFLLDPETKRPLEFTHMCKNTSCKHHLRIFTSSKGSDDHKCGGADDFLIDMTWLLKSKSLPVNMRMMVVPSPKPEGAAAAATRDNGGVQGVAMQRMSRASSIFVPKKKRKRCDEGSSNNNNVDVAANTEGAKKKQCVRAECPECGKGGFGGNKHALAHHMQVAHNKDHMETVLGAMVFVCPVSGCLKTGKKKQQITNHVRRVHSDLLFREKDACAALEALRGKIARVPETAVHEQQSRMVATNGREGGGDTPDTQACPICKQRFGGGRDGLLAHVMYSHAPQLNVVSVYRCLAGDIRAGSAACAPGTSGAHGPCQYTSQWKQNVMRHQDTVHRDIGGSSSLRISVKRTPLSSSSSSASGGSSSQQ